MPLCFHHILPGRLQKYLTTTSAEAHANHTPPKPNIRLIPHQGSFMPG